MSLPLPEPNVEVISGHREPFVSYDAEQLHAYGKACREAALEEAAVCAWSHYMDTCKANNIAPASSERWLASGKIRSLK